MPKVYFSKKIEKIIENIDFSRLGNNVAIKVHFGEKGCVTYLRPELVRGVYEKITSLGKKASLIECNVLYKGSRTSRAEHLKTARDHGFDMPIDILDGEDGSEFSEIQGCKIGKGIEKYDSLVVFSHFKGHQAAGFGGALKNIGMGLGSRAGKLDMHSNVNPSVDPNTCVGCGVCVENCNAQAISLSSGKAKIDQGKCEGCAMCIAVCANGAVQVPWRGRTAADLQKRIAEYSSAVLSLFPNAIFISALANITKECDCMGISQKPIMEDIGFLYSDDIVAVDKAGLDLAEKYSGGKFSKINPVDKEKQVEFAENLGLGNSKYELVEI
ncbi:MAG: DUF362 domain-containing protein [Parcubacteria group bacterium]|jgi:hypothetical protein